METTTAPARVGRRVHRRGGTQVQSAATEAAVRQVYAAHYGLLAGWARRLLGDPDLAHDLATEAFVRLIRNWDVVDEPRAWLYATTANLVRDHWRRRGREATAYDRFSAGRPPQEAVPGPDQAERLTVRDAVLALPDRLRAGVLLYYFADLSVAQVAAQLGRSEGAVKRDLFDARARMARLLEGVR
jgi:RNA polymerase sigma-70 factor (ECF subfamily)